jgi:ADP-ribose pyrophosphatase YjhB (NUDIX family)
MPLKDRELYRGEWLSVRRTADDYEYVHQQKMGREAVAVLGYVSSWLLGRFEICPPHGDRFPTLCALTGGIEPGESPVEAAVRELREESGFDVPMHSIRGLGTPVRPSKASDTVIHLFTVPIKTDQVEGDFFGPGDGTDGEKGAFCRFVHMREALNSKDPLLATMAARRIGL